MSINSSLICTVTNAALYLIILDFNNNLDQGTDCSTMTSGIAKMFRASNWTSYFDMEDNEMLESSAASDPSREVNSLLSDEIFNCTVLFVSFSLDLCILGIIHVGLTILIKRSLKVLLIKLSFLL